jgi:Fe-S-cluster containining protein
MSNATNPCLTCGACCAYFRVSFYWGEVNDVAGGFVPAELTEPVNQHLQCMKGTNRQLPRCIALRGEVGKQVSCAIYEQRPTSCREFNEYEPDGSPNMRCFKLRGMIPPATIRP